MNTIACSTLPNVVADVGAQFITTDRTQQRRFSSFYDFMFASKLLVPMKASVQNLKLQPDTLNYVAPHGFKSCVAALLREARCEPEFERPLVSLEQKGTRWLAASGANSKSGKDENGKLFDAVVTTMPVPELLKVRGFAELARRDASLNSTLERVSYKPRFAIAFFYDAAAAQRIMQVLEEKEKNVAEKQNAAWAAKFFYDNDAIRYVSLDPLRRGVDRMTIEQQGCALVVHTTVPFGVRHAEETEADALKIALEYMRGLLLAENLTLPEPVEVRCLRYSYSQAHQFFAETANPTVVGCVELPHAPPLIMAGDCCATKSALDGCLMSASRAADRIIELFDSTKVESKRHTAESASSVN